MKITVVGTGYVGLVTGTCFAEMGNDVLCFDTDLEKIRILNSGGVPIHEPGLKELIDTNVAAGRLKFTADAKVSVDHGDVQFIAVGTPPDEDGSADLKYVLAAADTIARHMNGYKLVVDKSTVPVGTAEKVKAQIAARLRERGSDFAFSVASNPEFLKEGAAIVDFMKPDRVVIGTEDDKALEWLRTLYAPFVRNHDCMVAMDIRSAELTKYAANAMLATRISFMNELANLAQRVGADIESVRTGIGSDSRIGYSFLYAGCGYGGSCFPKDVSALIRLAGEVGHSLQVVEAVERVNEAQKGILPAEVVRRFGEDLTGRKFALWGLAFKPDTDDMREAPSRVLIDQLTARGATIVAFDPIARDEAARIYAGKERISFAPSPLAACADVDALLIVTEWRAFRSIDLDALHAALKNKIVIDGRNLYSPAQMRQRGFDYFSIGRTRA